MYVDVPLHILFWTVTQVIKSFIMSHNPSFNTYRMPRIGDIPKIEVHIMENDEKPGGVGEPGLPALAPALCNAIFDLSGKRIRTLPFKLEEI